MTRDTLLLLPINFAFRWTVKNVERHHSPFRIELFATRAYKHERNNHLEGTRKRDKLRELDISSLNEDLSISGDKHYS